MPSPSSTFDSFSEPYTRQADESSLDDVRAHICTLEQQHKQNGIPLSGRIIHVCHDLPIIATYKPCNVSGIPSPPATPPSRSTEFIPREALKNSATNPTPDTSSSDPVSPSSSSSSPTVWSFAPRYGHAAMISGIRSLSTTHEQVIVGWTGDISCAGPTEKVSANVISAEDRIAFEEALKDYTPKESDPDDDKKTTYIPVWLDDKVAHGHYDGYCKQSEYSALNVLLRYDAHTVRCEALWPLFHYLLWQDVATEYASADQHYPYYESANAAFSQRIAEVYRPGDLIWVHDYHLLLVPKYVVTLL